MLRVLVVEHQDQHINGFIELLRRSGCATNTHAVDNAESLRIALQSEEWDFVIIGRSLPGFPPEEASHIAREIRSDMPIVFLQDPPKRKQAEEALPQSKEMLTLVLGTIPSWVFWKDRNSVYQGCNYLFAANAGFESPEDIVGKTDYDLPWTRAEAEAYRADDRAVMDSGVPKLNYEETQTTADGRIIWIRTSKVPLKDVDGDTIGILGTFEDFTEEKQAVEALRESEERYRAIFNSSADAFFLLDLDGYIIDVNPVALAMYGYSAEELIGKHGRDLVAPDYYHNYEDFIKSKYAEWFKVESVDVRSDGSLFEVEVYGTRVYYRGKEQLFVVVRDVTERNKAREELQMYADIIHNMQVGLYIYHLEDLNDDRKLKLVAVNPTSTTSLGLKEDELLCRYIDELFPELRKRQIPQRFADVVRTGEPFIIDDFVYQDEKLPLRHDSFRAFRIPGNRVGVLLEDITDMKQSEEERRLFYRETISSATDGKLIISSSEELVPYEASSDIVHEFTTPVELSSIRQQLYNYCFSKGLQRDSSRLFISGAGEAMNNALKHAGGGRAFCGCAGDGLWFGVSDKGPGISTLALPSAMLRRGYSTKISMGMGYSIMIDVADRVMLSTGPAGTTVILLMNLHKAKPEMSLADLPDIWNEIPNI